MLALMEWAVANGIAKNESQYLEKIGFPRTNIRNIRINHQGFTRDHIYEACKLTGASADYIFGFTNVRSRQTPSNPIVQLKEAVAAIELSMKSKVLSNKSKTSKV